MPCAGSTLSVTPNTLFCVHLEEMVLDTEKGEIGLISVLPQEKMTEGKRELHFTDVAL